MSEYRDVCYNFINEHENILEDEHYYILLVDDEPIIDSETNDPQRFYDSDAMNMNTAIWMFLNDGHEVVLKEYSRVHSETVAFYEIVKEDSND